MNNRDVIIACDFPTREQTISFLDRFWGTKPFVKIGMELFYSEGPSIVREIRDRGHEIFLDLKLFDIPNTVRNAMKSIGKLSVQMVNVHALGGAEMMRAALDGLEEGSCGYRPLLIAVTILTSMSKELAAHEMRVDLPLDEAVLHFARLASAAGADGVVCSPLESKSVKADCGMGFLAVTPGIRYRTSAEDDQARVTTPAEAAALGSDYIVVGRPITKAADPVASYMAIRQEFLRGGGR